MFRTLEEHAERFHGKSASLVVRLVRFKALVIGSVLVIGALLSVVMSLEVIIQSHSWSYTDAPISKTRDVRLA